VSESNGSKPKKEKSAAEQRAEKLVAKLGIETYVRYPRELLEYWMDRPPASDKERQGWRPVHSREHRVYATYLRYSWCWPICMEYAVLTDERDEILRERGGKGKPLLLTQERVAAMLGTPQPRVCQALELLEAKKVLRIDGRAVYPQPKPFLLAEGRANYTGTCIIQGLDGPPLPLAVYHRFDRLCNNLAVPDHLRTQMFRRVLDNRTQFLLAWKDARYSERQGYDEVGTWICNLMGHTHSSDRSGSSSSSVSQNTRESSAAELPLTTKEHSPRKGSSQVSAAGSARASTATATAPDPVEKAVRSYAPNADSKAIEQIRASVFKQRRDAKPSEIAFFIHEKAPLAKTNLLGFLQTAVPACFGDALDEWRKQPACPYCGGGGPHGGGCKACSPHQLCRGQGCSACDFRGWL
jgi:hypothetical protein